MMKTFAVLLLAVLSATCWAQEDDVVTSTPSSSPSSTPVSTPSSTPYTTTYSYSSPLPTTRFSPPPPPPPVRPHVPPQLPPFNGGPPPFNGPFFPTFPVFQDRGFDGMAPVYNILQGLGHNIQQQFANQDPNRQGNFAFSAVSSDGNKTTFSQLWG